MKLAIVTDEISLDFATSVELGTDWGITNFEIRSLASGRIPYVSGSDLKKVFDVVKSSDIKISALSPGAFKVPLGSAEAKKQIEDMLPRTYELAHRLEASIVVVFGFLKEGARGTPPTERIAEILHEVSEKAESEGIEIVLENEAVCWADTGEGTARIIRRASHPNLKINWDPCNSFWAEGKPYPDEYDLLRDLVGHLHIKDARKISGGYETTAIGDGDIDWRGQLGSLLKDGFKGYYTVETHYGPKVKASKRCVDNFKDLMIEVF